MDESNQQESGQIIHHWKELNFPNKISKYFFLVYGPRGPDRALWKFEPNRGPLRFFLNFVYTVYMAIGKIWLKKTHRQTSSRAPEGPSKFMNHGFCPMDESNQQESGQIIHHWKELNFPNKISKYFFLFRAPGAQIGPFENLDPIGGAYDFP